MVRCVSPPLICHDHNGRVRVCVCIGVNASVTLGDIPYSFSRWLGKTRPPNVFVVLLSLKTVQHWQSDLRSGVRTKLFLNLLIHFYLNSMTNSMTNLLHLTSHSTTSCPTRWRSCRDHGLTWRHFHLVSENLKFSDCICLIPEDYSRPCVRALQ